MNHIKTDMLVQLMGCYFHQDWLEEFPDDLAALHAIVEEVPKEQIIEGLVEIEHLRNAGLHEDELSAILVDRIGCYFAPDSQGLSYGQWLHRVRNVFADAVAS